MTKEFMREDRYIVFKMSDVERYLTDKDRANITMMKMEIDAGRDCANKPTFKGLIVEADWPEYEPTWKAIEARVTGAQPAPSTKDAIIDDLQSQFDSDGITEHDSGDALIRLSDAIAAVEDNFAGAQPAPNVPNGSAVQTAARIMNIELITERDALRAELDALKAWKEEVEKQEPLAWLIDWADEPDLGHYFSESAVDEDSGRSRPLFLHPVPASVPERITHDQAPHVYSQEAAEGYADGWNACVKKIVAAAPQNCIKAAMEAQREGCAEIVLQAAHKAADCNNLRDYELLRALSIEVAKAPEAKP